MGKRYYWLKLKDDFFSSKRIKKLRSMAGGDTYTIIYLKMQLLAMKTEGILTWTGLEDNFAEELALDLDEKPNDVEVTLIYLLKTGLAETQDNKSFFFPYAVENTASETAGAQRVREFRKREALQCNTDVTQMKRIGNADIEIEKDIEKEIETDTRDSRFAAVVEAWNGLGLSPIRKITGERERLLKARIKEYGEDGVLEAIGKIKDSDFLQGHGDRGWVITFDWFLGPRNFAKVLEGNYDARQENKSPKYASSGQQKPLDADTWDKILDAI